MPAPANDAFASAIALSTTLPGSRAGDSVVDATSEVGEPLTAANVYFGAASLQSAWYTLTPTATGRYRFSIRDMVDQAALAINAGISVYTGGAVGSLTHVASSYHTADFLPAVDDFGLHVDLTSGTTYRIMVYAPVASGESANDHTFDYDLEWDLVTVPSAPSNDDIDDAILITFDDDYVGTTKGATGDFDVDPDVWYRIDNGSEVIDIDITVTGEGDPDWFPYVEFYGIDTDPPTSLGDLNFIGWAGDGTNVAQILDQSLSNDTSYMMRITCIHYGARAGGDFTLTIAGLGPEFTPPPNDDFASVENANFIFNWNEPFELNTSLEYTSFTSFINRDAGKYVGTTELATAEADEPSHGGYGPTRSVWHLFRTGPTDGTYRFWVESAVDCVLSIYQYDPTISSLSELVSLAEDDDSGTGNWPQIDLVENDGPNNYWIVVDSKTEGAYTLKYQKLPTGTPPANDDFADAEIVSSLPYSIAGTTVGATAEPDEIEAIGLFSGPRDTVWYKYVADFDGQIDVWARCDSGNNDGYVWIDAFKGTTLDTLIRANGPPPDDNRGSYFQEEDEADRLANYSRRITVSVVNGQTYYLRVQTQAGGSEDFTIFIDEQIVYVNIQASGIDAGPTVDDATVRVVIEPSGVEDFHQVNALDDATIPIKITPGATWETHGHEYVDAATVYVDIRNTGGECYSTHMGSSMDMECDQRWTMQCDTRWSLDPNPRWTVEEIDGQGVHC